MKMKFETKLRILGGVCLTVSAYLFNLVDWKLMVGLFLYEINVYIHDFNLIDVLAEESSEDQDETD
jgi:hypothetical protein